MLNGVQYFIVVVFKSVIVYCKFNSKVRYEITEVYEKGHS